MKLQGFVDDNAAVVDGATLENDHVAGLSRVDSGLEILGGRSNGNTERERGHGHQERTDAAH